MGDEIKSCVDKMIGIYKSRGPSKALKLSQKALKDYPEFPLFHRLNAMFLYESDRSKLPFACVSSLNSVVKNPCSLEFRYYQIKLLSQLCKQNDVVQNLSIIYECETALHIWNPEETYWEYYRCLIDEKSFAHGMSKEEAVKFYKVAIINLMECIYREIDNLSQGLLDTMFFPYDDRHPKERLKITADLINGDHSNCALVYRMHSKFCFEYAVTVEDCDEKKKVLRKSLISARLAHVMFDSSCDYLINFCTKTLQCKSKISTGLLRQIKDKLKGALKWDMSIEPYYMRLIPDRFTDVIDLVDYNDNCIRALLIYIKTMEEKCFRQDIKYGDNNHRDFILTYCKYLEEGGLKKFLEESIVFAKNILYLLNNIPNINKCDENHKSDLQRKVVGESSYVSDIVDEIIEIYKKRGPSEAKIQTFDALAKYSSSSILQRLASKFIYDTDRSEIDFALEYAKKAVSSCETSLEHRYHQASLLFTKAVTVSPKDIMLYWEIIWLCHQATNMNRVSVESLQLFRIFHNYKVEDLNTEEEIVDYLRYLFENLTNMCFRAIDGIPKKLVDSFRHGNIEEKLSSMNEMLNSKFRLNPFFFRVYSQFCFEYVVLKNVDSKIKWLSRSHICAKAAMKSFPYSMDYKITYFTRKLQVLCFTPGELQVLKKNLKAILGFNNNCEPYYKYLVQNDLSTPEELRFYFDNVIMMLLVYVKLIEEVDQNIENQDTKFGEELKLKRTIRNIEAYCGFLDEYKDLKEFALRSRFYNWDIRYLLENPPMVFWVKGVDKSEYLQQDSSKKKRKKNKKSRRRKFMVDQEEDKESDICCQIEDDNDDSIAHEEKEEEN